LSSIGHDGAYGSSAKSCRVCIGTSGWHYAHWRGIFYPADLKSSKWLDFYAGKFQTVEINNSFYKLPGEETFRRWRETSPDGFCFAVKASRFITHMKKLTDPQASTAKFFERVALLGDKLGPILFQLPPRWSPNLERLDAFLSELPAGGKYAFEFRDPSWLIQPVYEILARHNVALCVYDFNRRTSPKERTADFVYVRLHGPGGPYQGKYSPEAIGEWAREIAAWSQPGQGQQSERSVYCYFDNDTAGYAPQNAQELIRELEWLQ